MSIKIEALLKENSAVSAYKIYEVKTESYEMFFVGEKLETVRSTDTVSTTVTVYNDHDGKKGDASFSLYASTEEDEAREKIADAVKKAAMVNNEYYTLPAGETLQGKVPSDFENYTLAEVAAKVADAVWAADRLQYGSINSLEIFINKLTVSVKNSEGIDKKEEKYSAMVEAIPTWNEGESVELYHVTRFGSLDLDHIRQGIAEKMCQVRDRGYAQPPKEKLTCPVLLKSEELCYLMASITGELNYSAVYAHSNFYQEGAGVQKTPTGDKMTLTRRGKVPGSVQSALFDADGTTLCDTTVVKDGVVVNYFGGDRFAQYLGREATGALPCIELAPGSVDTPTEPYFECVSMSSPQLDVYNDYIGGEVRLGYYVANGQRTPVTGISLSGKLSEALNSVRLSKDCENYAFYYGPKFAIFDGIDIV